MSGTDGTGCGAGCTCDACRGIRDETPLAVDNRPGLSAIRYRVGDHARFKESLLAGLSRAALPALRDLTTRRDDDFSIGLLDACAVMADVLTFYQERIANESYLRTATERISIGYIARLIGYELRPGAAARTTLAFGMQEGAGAVEKLKLPVGTRVQSTPGPEEKAQVFETVEEVEVRPEWNRIPARALEEQPLGPNTDRVRLKGAGLNLHPGDGFLLVFPAGTDFTAVFRRVRAVEVEPKGQWTTVSLTGGPALATGTFGTLPPPQTGAFVFRKHASLFGYNAPDFVTLDQSKATPTNAPDWTVQFPSTAPDWITLDGVYREAVVGSWGVWESPGVSVPLIFKVATAVEAGLSAYALSGKVSLLNIEKGKDNTTSVVPLSFAALRSVSVLVQPEKLELAETPVFWPVFGDKVFFAQTVEGLVPGRMVAVEGKRLRAEVLKPVTLYLFTTFGVTQKSLLPDDRLDLLFFPIPLSGGAVTAFFAIENGLPGLLFALPGQVRYRNDETAVEVVSIRTVAPDRKSITVDPPLAQRYDPPSVTLNANLAESTHGETVRETFAGGDATRGFQRFPLQQTPLTHVPATTPSGVRSTLRVWVDEVEWREVPALYGRGPNDRVFIIRRDGEGKTWIQFGDGITGARLPTGQRNVRAVYRRGIGTAGILKAGQINLLLDRPAGLTGAANPLPSVDGKDPEVLEDARRNAPLTVLTLDRVVSLQDYEDFALAYAGIYKALATWTWFRSTRGVFLTIAGFNGGAVSLVLRQELRDALAKWGDPFVPTDVANHAAVTFRTGLRVKVDPDRESAKVLGAVEKALRLEFSFERRGFGQRVTLAAVASAAQGVRGVAAVQVARLYRSGDSDLEAGLFAPLLARAPQPGERDMVLPAELLTLDPAPLDLLEELP
ncbi:MAG TPA: hypothetical protein VGA78_05600 [Gemmatimonadales bacterium]